MISIRWMMAGALACVWLASVGTVAGYAWYYRSAPYRAHCAEMLSDNLSLPAQIGASLPRSRRAHAFGDVAVFMPDGSERIFHCRHALVSYYPPPNADDYFIALADGEMEVSTRTWLAKDFWRLLKAGVQPGFDLPGLTEVRFEDMRLELARDHLQFTFEETAGTLRFPSRTQGSAQAIAGVLNGHRVTEPIKLTADFSAVPTGVQLDALVLEMPPVPLHTLMPAGQPSPTPPTGTFEGRVTHRDAPSGGRTLSQTTIAGWVRDADLAALIEPYHAPAWRGQLAEAELQSFEIIGHQPARVALRARLEQLHLGDLLRDAAIDPGMALANVNIRACQVERWGIQRLALAGSVNGIDLAAVAESLDRGAAQGVVDVTIEELLIVDNRLQTLSGVVRLRDESVAAWVEGRLLTELLAEAVGFNLPFSLPGQVTIRDAGVRFEVQDEVLYLFGTHGADENVILTATIMGQGVPLAYAPETPLEIANWLDPLRTQLEDWLRAVMAPLPATQPPRRNPTP